MRKHRLQHQIKYLSRRLPAFTLLELLIVIAIIAIVISILIPALSSARAHGRVTACLSNLRGQGLSLLGYTVDYQSALPPRLEWSYVDLDGRLVNEVLANHDHQEFDPAPQPHDWRKPTGIWRCPDAKDNDRRTHSGILFYAPNLWLFNSVISYDGEEYDIQGDAPAGWDDELGYGTWRLIDKVRQPSEIIALADNVNYFHPPHNTREARESMGFSWMIESDPLDSENGILRASHARLFKRPVLMVDGHAECLPIGPTYWEDGTAQYHPRGNLAMTTTFFTREVQRFMWFMTGDEIGGGSP